MVVGDGMGAKTVGLPVLRVVGACVFLVTIALGALVGRETTIGAPVGPPVSNVVGCSVFCFLGVVTFIILVGALVVEDVRPTVVFFGGPALFTSGSAAAPFGTIDVLVSSTGKGAAMGPDDDDGDDDVNNEDDGPLPPTGGGVTMVWAHVVANKRTKGMNLQSMVFLGGSEEKADWVDEMEVCVERMMKIRNCEHLMRFGKKKTEEEKQNSGIRSKNPLCSRRPMGSVVDGE